jgi:hypothetical protein
MSAMDLNTRHWFPRLLMAFVALLCAEGFLQVVLSRTMENSMWFTGDIHVPDQKYGFRFTPDHSGWMRFKNELFLEHLSLDDRGDRQPAGAEQSSHEVVLIGGYSMTFSYGVPDSSTIHHVLADHLKKPGMVRNTAWPGFDLYRNFHIYRDQVKGDKRADVAVLLFYRDDLWMFSDLPENQEEFIDTKPRADLFRAFKRHACAPLDGSVMRNFSALYYRSIICHKLADRSTAAAAALARFMPSRKLINVPIKEAASTELGRKRLRAFTSLACGYFGGTDHVLFVVLPGAQAQEHVDELLTGLPDNAHVLDLNRTSNDTIARLGTFALGHYSAGSCAYVGEQIARAIDALPEQ